MKIRKSRNNLIRENVYIKNYVLITRYKQLNDMVMFKECMEKCSLEKFWNGVHLEEEDEEEKKEQRKDLEIR